jgi:hypothetical protein
MCCSCSSGCFREAIEDGEKTDEKAAELAAVERFLRVSTWVNKSIKAGVLKSRISHCSVTNSLQIHRCMFSSGGFVKRIAGGE